MIRSGHLPRGVVLALSALLVAVIAAAAVVGVGRAAAGPAPRYYISLGDSLSRGIQPDSHGHNRFTSDGYVDYVLRSLNRSASPVRAVRLGCGGTTATLMAGPPCDPHYGHASQLVQAERFLAAHKGKVALVTVDIGDNDVEGCLTPTSIDRGCVRQTMADVRTNLPKIARRLRVAAGSRVAVVGIADYDQFLAGWLRGAAGRRLARASVPVIRALGDTMRRAYAGAGVTFADAGPRFATTTSFRRTAPLRGYGRVPFAVARICAWTWACSGPPVNFNDHAKVKGYRAIGAAVLDALARVRGDATGGAGGP